MELRDYLHVLRARRGVIILAATIVTVTAVAVSLIQSPVYESEARVLVSEKDAGAAIFGTVLPELSSQPERGLQTQVQLVSVRPVAEATIRKLDLSESPEELMERVVIGGVGQTNIISIKARAGSPENAAAIANTMAEEYVASSRERKRASVREAANEVEQRLEQARIEILNLGRRIQQSGKSDDLAAELQILTGTYTTLAEKLEQLRINERLEGGSGAIVQPAVADGDPVAPLPLRNGMLGAVVGLVFGVGVAFLYEYMDNTVKTSEEAERLYGAPVLGIVPLEKLEKGVARQLTIISQPGSPAAEAYRVLRNSLDFINFEHNLKTVLVTSAVPNEGKSTVASNLAASLVQAGKKVVLVSCDFRKPTTDQFFKVNNMIGLSDVLLGTHSLKAALQQPIDDQLLVLTAGKMPPNPSELLSSSKMQEVIASLSEWADWVIVDAPPVLAVADPVSVARWADGVLLVSKAGSTLRDNARKAVELLDRVGARKIGTVVWGVDDGRAHAFGQYTGGYYYQQSYYSSPGEGGGRSGAQAQMASTGASRRPGLAVSVLLVSVLLVVVIIALTLLDSYLGFGLPQLFTNLF